MENSFKFNDITSNNASAVSEEESINLQDNLSNQFDQLTGSQMKEIEEKKIEDEINIKRLEKEYRDRQKGLAYSIKKLNEYRKERINSTELMKCHVLASETLIENSNQLKRFHYDVLSDNVDNAENVSAEDKKKIAELTMTFKAITMRDNSLKSSIERLQYKASEVNSNIARQIGQRDEERKKCSEKLTKSTSRIEALKKELNQQTINSNLKNLIEKNGTRMIELEAETGKLQKQLKQELDAILQDKNKLIQEKTNSKKSIQENDKLICTLQSETSISEKNNADLKRNVELMKTEKEKLFKQVEKERENVDLSKNVLVEKTADIESELARIKENKQNLINNFTIAEESMHSELKKLYNEIDLKKSLSQKLENYQRIHLKLNEDKILSKKMFSNLGLDDKLNKAKNDLKKHEEILLSFNKKKNNFELKVKELEQKKIQENKKLESSTKENEETLGDKLIEVSTKLNTAKNEVTVKKVQILPKSLDFPSLFSYKLSDSDESEDEFKIKDDSLKNSTVSLSSSELFNNMFNKSSQGQTTDKKEDTKDVFKFPQAVSQYKRKTPQPKKKN